MERNETKIYQINKYSKIDMDSTKVSEQVWILAFANQQVHCVFDSKNTKDSQVLLSKKVIPIFLANRSNR